MLVNSRHLGEDLVHSVEGLERTIHGHLAEPSSAVMAAKAVRVCFTEPEETSSAKILSMTQALAAAEAAKEKEKDFASQAQFQMGQGIDSSATVAKVLEIAVHATNRTHDKLAKLVIDVDKQAISKTLKKCDSNHNKMYAHRQTKTRYEAGLYLSYRII